MDFVSTAMVAGSSSTTGAAVSGKQQAGPGMGFPAMLAMLEQRDLGTAQPDDSRKDVAAGDMSKEAAAETKTAGAKRRASGEKKAAAEVSPQTTPAATAPVSVIALAQIPTPMNPSETKAIAQNESGLSSDSDTIEDTSPSSAPAFSQQVGSRVAASDTEMAGTIPEIPAQTVPASEVNMGISTGNTAVQPEQALPESVAQTQQGASEIPPAQPQAQSDNFPGATAAVSAEAHKNAATTIASHLESATLKDSAKPKAGASQKTAAAVAVDPKVQNAVSAVVASAEARATESHASHADVKLPTVNSAGRSSKEPAKHEIQDLIPGAAPDRSASPASHDHGKKDTDASTARVAEPAASGSQAPAKSSTTSASASESPVVSSVLAASSSNRDLGKSGGEPAPPAPSAAAPAHTSDLPHVGTIVNSASLLEQVGKSEIKVGVRVGEFGNVEIRTQVDHQQVRAEISVAHHELGHALAAEMPALQERLRDHDVALMSLNLTGQGASHDGNGSQENTKQGSTPGSAVGLPASVDSISAMPVLEQISAGGGLDIRI